MSLPHLQLLSRQNCCLCDQSKPVLEALAKQQLCTWETVNVDHNKALLVRYGMDVPVLLMHGKELFRHNISAAALKSILVELQHE